MTADGELKYWRNRSNTVEVELVYDHDGWEWSVDHLDVDLGEIVRDSFAFNTVARGFRTTRRHALAVAKVAAKESGDDQEFRSVKTSLRGLTK